MKKLKLAALLAAVIVGLGLYRFLQELKTPQEVPHTTVVVAAVDIPENTQITEEMVTLRSISNDSLLTNYILEMESVIGMVMTSDVYAGEQIVRDRLIRLGESDSDQRSLAYTVEPGMRAVTIFIDKDSGLENFLKPGNRVDVLASYAREEIQPVLNEPEKLEKIHLFQRFIGPGQFGKKFQFGIGPDKLPQIAAKAGLFTDKDDADHTITLLRFRHRLFAGSPVRSG